MRKKSIWIYHITYTHAYRTHSGQEHTHTDTQFLPANDNDDSACHSLHVCKHKNKLHLFSFCCRTHIIFIIHSPARERWTASWNMRCAFIRTNETCIACCAVQHTTKIHNIFIAYISDMYRYSHVCVCVCANSKLYLRIPTISSHHTG